MTNYAFIMPSLAMKVTATYKAPEKSDAIEDVMAAEGDCQIYTLDGKQVETLQKGVNIIKYENGQIKKVFVK